MTVREYAINYTGKDKPGGARVVGGGNAVLTTGPHALDGPEHKATTDQTRLDASATAHGLLPKLSGLATDRFTGAGTFVPDSSVSHDLGSIGATATADLANGTWQYGTMTASPTITTTGWVADEDDGMTLELAQGAGGFTPTIVGVTWIGGTPVWDTTAGTTTLVGLLSRDGGTTIEAAIIGGGGGSSLTVKDEGTPLATAATSLDFVGAGVTASGTGAGKTITIPGGGAADTNIWRPLMDGAGAVITDGTGQAVMAYGPA